MDRFILAIDQGTTTTTCLLVNQQLEIVASRSSEFTQYYPQPGWVEHDLDEIWDTTCQVISQLLAGEGIAPERIAAIGITNQRETTGVWEADGGAPIHRAIVWQCRRTADKCHALREAGHQDLIRARSGLVIDPYFSGTKLGWLLDNVTGARARASSGALRFGTIDTFLVDRLTSGAAHVTDVSNASRTQMFDIHKLAWDQDLIGLVGGEASCLPRVVDSSEVYHQTRGLSVLPDGIPIAGMAGDQQAALFGQACFEPGMVKATYGTGSFILMNTGPTAVPSANGLLTTVGWRIGGQVTYALEGSAFVAGAMVQWLRDGLGIIQSSADVEALAAEVDDSGGVVVVPALAGLGAPHWRAEARGLISGLTRGSTRAHIARATLEGIALQNADLMQAMVSDSGHEIPLVRVDGGAAGNDLLMQFQADVLAAPISRPQVLETTALGAAALAGLAVGFYPSQAAITSSWQEQHRFAPDMDGATRQAHLQRWHSALEKA